MSARGLLRQNGHDVSVAALGEPKPGSAAVMCSRWDGPLVSLYEARPRRMLVDGMFGTGMTRPLERGPPRIARRAGGGGRFQASRSTCPRGWRPTPARTSAPRRSASRSRSPRSSPPTCSTRGWSGAAMSCSPTSACPSRRPGAPPAARASPRRPPGDHKYSRGMVVAVECAMPGAARLAARAACAGGGRLCHARRRRALGGRPRRARPHPRRQRRGPRRAARERPHRRRGDRPRPRPRAPLRESPQGRARLSASAGARRRRLDACSAARRAAGCATAAPPSG